MALVSLSMSADSLKRLGRAGCDFLDDLRELIVFIADSAAAVYFLFGGADAPHLVVNIVLIVFSLICLLCRFVHTEEAFDFFAEIIDEDDAEEEDDAETHCRIAAD